MFGKYLVSLGTVGLFQDLHSLNIGGRGFINASVADIRDAYGLGASRRFGLRLVESGL